MFSTRTCKGVTLPLSVRALAAQSGVSAPISLRGLGRKTGTHTKVLRVALLRYAWATPMASATPPPAQWSDAQVREIFFAENDWSGAQFWWRGSLGLVDIRADLFPWRTLPGKQADLDKARGDVNALIRRQAAADGVDLSKYDRVVTIVDPPPGDRGATGGDVVVDEAPFSFEFFQHELGHMIGISHTFGKDSSGTIAVYNDDFDVMGNTNPNARTIPTPTSLAALPLPAGVNFWRSGRRVSGASLYRYFGTFANSPGVVRPTLPATVRLVALTRGRYGDPVVAVVSTDSGEVTVEYRVRADDDAGIGSAPLLLMHTIGRRQLPQGAGEVRPIVLEGTSSSTPGTVIATAEGDVSARVIEGGDGGPSVTLRIEKH